VVPKVGGGDTGKSPYAPPDAEDGNPYRPRYKPFPLSPANPEEDPPTKS